MPKDRGEFLRGAPAIAEWLLHDKTKFKLIYPMAEELGLFNVGRLLCGYSGDIEEKLSAKSQEPAEQRLTFRAHEPSQPSQPQTARPQASGGGGSVMAILTPGAIGEAHAVDAWACRGRSLVLRPKAYHEALDVLAERLDGEDLVTATSAFDRRLAELAADGPVIRPKLPVRRSRRRR